MWMCQKNYASNGFGEYKVSYEGELRISTYTYVV